MRRRTSIFGKLCRAEKGDILDALNRCRIGIRREALITEDRKALFQRKLEPVTTGDTVA